MKSMEEIEKLLDMARNVAIYEADNSEGLDAIEELIIHQLPTILAELKRRREDEKIAFEYAASGIDRAAVLALVPNKDAEENEVMKQAIACITSLTSERDTFKTALRLMSEHGSCDCGACAAKEVTCIDYDTDNCAQHVYDYYVQQAKER